MSDDSYSWMLRGIVVACLSCLAPVSARASVRIKDITDIQGTNSNKVTGYGLVVGLNGTGAKNIQSQKVAVDMLQRFKVSTKIIANVQGDDAFKSSNIATVMVTAEIGPYARVGSRIDVTVSVVDDATSISNGMLLPTPLKGLDGVDYILSGGTVSTGAFAFSASGGGTGTAATAQKNHPTVGRVIAGGDVVREARGKMVCDGRVGLLLRDPDSDTARAIEKAINERFPNSAFTIDAGTVNVYVPPERSPNIVSFISDIGMLQITPDTPARVVINPRTGTIVAGHQVKISTTAVTHANLIIVTSNEPIVSQPLPYSKGKTTVLPRAQIKVLEQGDPNGDAMRVLEQTMTVGELARALNALGAAPRDLIAIFEALDKLGALHAKLVFM